MNYGFDQFQLLSLGDSDFSIISGGDVVVPNGTAEDSLTTEDTQNGDEIDRTYLFNGAAVGSAVLEVTQAQDTASVQEGEQNMQAAREYILWRPAYSVHLPEQMQCPVPVSPQGQLIPQPLR